MPTTSSLGMSAPSSTPAVRERRRGGGGGRCQRLGAREGKPPSRLMPLKGSLDFALSLFQSLQWLAPICITLRTNSLARLQNCYNMAPHFQPHLEWGNEAMRQGPAVPEPALPPPRPFSSSPNAASLFLPCALLLQSTSLPPSHHESILKANVLSCFL